VILLLPNGKGAKNELEAYSYLLDQEEEYDAILGSERNVVP
jgi:hypothetical protein